MDEILLEARLAVSAVVGVIAFAIALRLDVPPRLDLLMAFIAAAGAFLSIPKKVSEKPKSKLDDESEKALNEMSQKIDRVRKLSEKILKKDVQEQAFDVCKSAERLIEECRDQPSIINDCSRMLPYILDETGIILDKYVGLSEKGARSTLPVRQQTERALPSIQAVLDDMFERAQKGEAFNLQIELKAFDNTLKLQGLDTKKEATE